MDQCSPLGWSYCSEQEGVEELKRFLVQTTMELEATVMAAQDEISRKEEEMVKMRDLLMVVVKERDEAQYKCQKLLLEKLTLQQELQQMQSQLRKPGNLCGVMGNNIEDNKGGSGGGKGGDTNASSFSSDDSDESIISSELALPQLLTPTSSSPLPPRLAQAIGKKRALPEKGKLLQAVMEAGPTLQTLMLAGPLPEWQHPPPQLDSNEIPLVAIHASQLLQVGMLVNTTSYNNAKRSLDTFDGYSPTCSKYQRVV